MPWILPKIVGTDCECRARKLSQAAKTQAGLREMITLEHLVAGRQPSTLGLSAEGLAKTILVILLVVLVAGIIAIWNRSQYRRR